MEKPGEPFFSAILVAWESGRDLPGCIGALAAARERAAAGGVSVELVVVDNGSADFAPGTVTSLWPDARVIVNPDNRGFAVAANQGARLASGNWLLLLNPDTRAEGDPLTAMAEYARAHPAVVALAPRLVSPEPERDAPDDFQLRRLPTLGSLVRDALLLDHVWPGNRWRARERYLDVDREATFEVEQPAASALAVRRDVFAACGGFDEAYSPAWFEDVDLATRLRHAGRIVYLPAAASSTLAGPALSASASTSSSRCTIATASGTGGHTEAGAAPSPTASASSWAWSCVWPC
jgi:GT2 family glycosyltransferase